MNSDLQSVANRLSDTECECLGWKRAADYYIRSGRFSKQDVPQLIHLATRWTDPEWPGDEFEQWDGSIDVELLPVAAWRTLGELGSEECIKPLVAMMRELGDDFDLWTCEELPVVMGKCGPAAFEPLVELAKDTNATAYARSLGATGLRWLAEGNPDLNDQIIEVLIEILARPTESVEFNSSLMGALLDLGATSAAEEIERAFSENHIDVAMCGDWNDVRQQLGVEGIGLPMPEVPYNSFKQTRSKLLALEQKIFDEYGEMDRGAAREFLDSVHSTFVKSPEGQEVIQRYAWVGWAARFLDFSLDYRGDKLLDMSPATIDDILFDVFPRKMSVESRKAGQIVFELLKFWEYLDRQSFSNAASMIECLSEPGIAERLEAELADYSNFGMAKSFVMMGEESGFDMTTEEGHNAFIALFNARLQQLHSSPEPAPEPPTVNRAFESVTVRNDASGKVGRNDPCPCGSGKKFKKCCR